MAETLRFNFRVFTVKSFGVQKFRNFIVYSKQKIAPITKALVPCRLSLWSFSSWYQLQNKDQEIKMS